MISLKQVKSAKSIISAKHNFNFKDVHSNLVYI